MAKNSYWNPVWSTKTITTRDEIVSLQLFQLNSALIAIVFGFFCLGLLLTDFRVNISSYAILTGIAGLYGCVGYLNARSASGHPRVYATLFMLAQFILMIVLITSLGYIAAAANRPMQEASLLAFDRMLGFDFQAYLSFVNERPTLASVLEQVYGSIHRQLLVLILLLPIFGHTRRAAEFALSFAITLILTTIISALVPAIGAYQALGLQPADYSNINPFIYLGTLKELPLLRDGTTRELNAFFLGPVLTFPSFHAISAVLYIWAFWPFRWLRIVALLWNVVMLASTPIGGGHFLADVAAGMIVAVVVIYTVYRLGEYIARDNPQRDARMLPAPSDAPILNVQ